MPKKLTRKRPNTYDALQAADATYPYDETTTTLYSLFVAGDADVGMARDGDGRRRPDADAPDIGG